MAGLQLVLKGIEAVTSHSAVMPQWQNLLHDEIELLRPFLRPRPKLARFFPRLDEHGPPFRVVDRGNGAFVGICQETSDSIPLNREQLIVYELDRRCFATHIAKTLSIEIDSFEEASRSVFRLGCVIAKRGQIAVFLVFPVDSSHVEAATAKLLSLSNALFCC